MTQAMRDEALAMAEDHQARASAAIKDLLGRWISEVEPVVAYDRNYRVIGLSYGGEIVLRSDKSAYEGQRATGLWAILSENQRIRILAGECDI